MDKQSTSNNSTNVLDQMLYEGRLTVEDYCRLINTKAAAETRVNNSKFQPSNESPSGPSFK